MKGLDEFDDTHSGGLPPARIPIDQHSRDQELLDGLIAQIVAAQARNDDIVLIESVAERLLPEWPILAHGARSDFVRRLEALIQGPCAREMRGQYRYERLAQPHTRGRIIIQSTPAKHDPRGRTQAWQALQRRAARALQRPTTGEVPGQLSLDDLAGEGGLFDE